ncbi:MAG TPA: radical SAM protein, partial [Phycisphaerae bacterium]|nr:radical SAM protein [Phycisphaerae bacterium]
YPSCFTDEMIKTLADCRNVVKYIDMPLQHINDEILQSMRRKVTRKQIETLLEKLRKWVPGITLRTTFISGFPGETDAQHKELLSFIKDFGFENVGVFEYSPEPGTPAGRLHETDAVAADVAAARKEEIMLAQQKLVLKKNATLAGTTMKVLVDEANAKKHTAVARSAGQAPDIDGRVLLKKSNLVAGEFATVKIKDFNYYDLIAEPVARIESQKAAEGKIRSRLSLPVVAVLQSVEERGKRH